MSNRRLAALQVGAVVFAVLVVALGWWLYVRHENDQRVQELASALASPPPADADDLKWHGIVARLTPAEKAAICADLGQEPPPGLEREWPATDSPEYGTAVGAIAVMCMELA